ncbi:hypothetical protein B7P43_G12917 [Cryptotermes secundus]|uniref:SGNH hydrolase-type esterase domain-containing protein n=1 Tax=Cryptotermes secundus TaxID=105785 RepID=A0A2J7QIZ1_9NEOP|nr:hypothetical protein B7P43_G12917 [Cryptotermes secundus]
MNEVNNHNIIIVGDSHSKGSALRVGEYLGKKFQVYGMVEPGASVVDMVTQSSTKYEHLTKKKDVIVFQGGASDVYFNYAKGALLQIDISYRYDLENNSILNKEIQTFNRKLRKVTKYYNHVTIIELSLNREAFTQHGLHLNRLTAKQICVAMEIYGLIERNVDSSTSLEWKSVPKVNLQTVPASSGFDNLEAQQNHSNSKQIYSVHEDIQVRRYSTRSNKLPVTRNGVWIAQSV